MVRIAKINWKFSTEQNSFETVPFFPGIPDGDRRIIVLTSVDGKKLQTIVADLINFFSCFYAAKLGHFIITDFLCMYVTNTQA